MDLLTYVLLGLAVALSLSGTLIVSHALKAEVSRLRERVEALSSRYEELRLENERLKLELERVREAVGRIDDLEEVIKLLLEKKEAKDSSPSKATATRDPMLDLKIISLHKQGYSLRKIAEVVGLSKSTVHRIIKKALAH